MADDKAALRQSVLKARDSLPTAERLRQTQALSQRLVLRPEWQAARGLMLYLGIRSEWDPAPLVQQALEAGQRVFLPRIVTSPRHLEVREVRHLETDLKVGQWGLREPDPARCPLVPPEAIDCILVPGVAFDRQGQRLGYGAGYYDRLLGDPALHAFKIAALFQEQFVDKIPVEPHDIPVDLLILPDQECWPES